MTTIDASYYNPEAENTKSLSEYLFALKRFKRTSILVAAVILLLVIAVAFLLPPVYRSKSLILIEQQEIPEDLVRSTVTSYADQRIQTITQRVLRSQNLIAIIEKYDLYADDRKRKPREVILDDMREDIRRDIISADVVDPRSGRPIQATIAFSLAYDNTSPTLAQKVSSELTSLFLNENLETRTQMATETSSFLTDEAQKLLDRIGELERKIAIFKQDNAGRLPELVDLNMRLIDRTEREISDIETQLRSLREREIYLNAEIAQLSPTTAVLNDNGERVMSPSGRLKVLQSHYVTLKANYSDSHPDVQKIKKEIDALEGEVDSVSQAKSLRAQLMKAETDLLTAKERYLNSHPDVKRLERIISSLSETLVDSDVMRRADANASDNPAYIQLETQLNAAQVEQSSLRSKVAQLKTKLLDYESRLMQTPQIEREYRALVRDYENASVKYQEIRAKQMEAKLAESLEIGRKGERFTLIEPPLLPEKPESPNRLAIIFLGFILSLGGGIGSAFLRDALDPTINTRNELSQLLGAAPLALIPAIELTEEKRKRHIKTWLIIAGMILSILLAFVVLHLAYKPLDVLWFVLMRKLGI